MEMNLPLFNGDAVEGTPTQNRVTFLKSLSQQQMSSVIFLSRAPVTLQTQLQKHEYKIQQ